MTEAQQREAIRLLRVLSASSMANTKYSPHVEEWIGWQSGELEGVRSLTTDARKLLVNIEAQG